MEGCYSDWEDPVGDTKDKLYMDSEYSQWVMELLWKKWFADNFGKGGNMLTKNAKQGIECREYINKAPHYNRGKIEVIAFIEDQQLGFHDGNVVKYICRAGFKETTDKISDLKKARNYLDKYITYCENLINEILNAHATEDIN